MKRPWLAERLLESFIADPDLSDTILGDLTEEWTERVSKGSRVAAGIWYWQQSLRTMPHLVRLWFRDAPARAVLRRLLAVSAMCVLAWIPIFMSHMIAEAILEAERYAILIFAMLAPLLGETPPPWAGAIPVSYVTDAVTTSILWGLLGAYGLASVSRAAPMVSVALLGAVWVPASLRLVARLSADWPTWYFVAFPTLMMCAIALGGILAVAMPVAPLLRNAGTRLRTLTAGAARRA